MQKCEGFVIYTAHYTAHYTEHYTEHHTAQDIVFCINKSLSLLNGSNIEI